MLRVVLTVLLPIVLPLAVYAAYIWFARRRAARNPAAAVPEPGRATWIWMGVAGLLLAAAVLITVRFLTPAADPWLEQVEPPRNVEGEVQPSRIVPRRPSEVVDPPPDTAGEGSTTPPPTVGPSPPSRGD